MLSLQLFHAIQVISSVDQSCSLFVTPKTAVCQASLSITNRRGLLKLISIESVMPSNYLILCPPLLLLPSIFPSIRVFSSELILRIRWPKYWSFSFSISPSNEYFLKSSSTPQFKSINSLALSFLYIPFSYPYMTTGKTTFLTRQTFVTKNSPAF